MNKTELSAIVAIIAVVGIIIWAILGLSTDVGTDNVRDTNNHYKQVCLDGVVYYEGYYRLAPAFNADSTVKTCQIGVDIQGN